MDLALAEHGEKKMKAIKEMDEKLRGKPINIINATVMPDDRPVNERD